MYRFALPIIILLLSMISWAQADDEIVYSLGPFDVLGESRSVLEVGGGAFNISAAETVGAVKAEGRLGRKLSFLGPALGVVANKDGGVFGYVAAYIDIAVGERFTLIPLGGFGAYRRGDSKDLGGTFGFRSSLTLNYRLTERFGLGATIGHVSNGKLYSRNPGQDDFFLVFFWRF